MSQPPVPSYPPYDSTQFNGSSPREKALRQLDLAVTFNYIAIGFDAFCTLGSLGVGIFFAFVGDSLPKDPGDPPPWFYSALYISLGIILLICVVLKSIGTRKLQLRGPKAWGWGLTTAIVGCAQLLCISCCFLQVAVGIYTVVVLSSEQVKAILAPPPPDTLLNAR